MPCSSISCSCFSMSARKASGTRLGGTFTGDPTVQIRCSMTLCSTNRDAHVVYLLPMHHLDLFIFAPVALQKGERDTQVQFRRRRHRCFGMFLRSWVDPDAGTVVLSLVWHICEPRRRGQNFYCLIHFPLRMIALGCLRLQAGPLHCVAPTQCGGLDDGCWGYLKLGPFSSVAHDGGPLRLGRSSLNAFQNGNSVLGDRFFRTSNSVAVTVAVRFFLTSDSSAMRLVMDGSLIDAISQVVNLPFHFLH
ncbi:hypothetical protein T01_4977 [Trichinella spiralis]|uniref:Uncharacterized protein n=1 Tax=Trichinella spiralis TaxID=6334 RepID=A0A0V1B8D2_TRISP|nr:hypothetical protein T01_4977 [Trichinella spiralis]